MLAALLEAALGALFLEHGFAAIEPAVIEAFAGRIEYALTTHVDHKTELQEALARTGRQVSYAVLSAEGPPHDRHFTCAALIDGEQFGVGSGGSKKAAEQEAAREALASLAAQDLAVAPLSRDASPSASRDMVPRRRRREDEGKLPELRLPAGPARRTRISNHSRTSPPPRSRAVFDDQLGCAACRSRTTRLSGRSSCSSTRSTPSARRSGSSACTFSETRGAGCLRWR